jgi:hypothetical protein
MIKNRQRQFLYPSKMSVITKICFQKTILILNQYFVYLKKMENCIKTQQQQMTIWKFVKSIQVGFKLGMSYKFLFKINIAVECL